jgi:hypothetical protein
MLPIYALVVYHQRIPRRNKMSRIRNILPVFFVIGMAIFGLSVQADAQRRNEKEVRDIVRSLNSKIDDFSYDLKYQLTSSSADQQDIDDATRDLRDLQDKIRTFETNMDARRENRDDVSEIIAAAKNIDGFLLSNRQNRQIQNDWSGVRNLIDRLAASYTIVPDWNNTGGYQSGNSNDRNSDTYPAPTTSYPRASQNGSLNNGLSGTYRLDTSRSENTDEIIADANVAEAQRQDLKQKIDAPDQISIDIRGNQVTLASSNSRAVTFTADGREITDRDSAGRTVRVKATMRGQELTVSSIGGDTDYTVTFVPQDNGRTLKVTRRITTPYLQQTVFADSIYTKTDTVAQGTSNSRQNGTYPDDSNGGYSSSDQNDRNTPYGNAPSAGTSRTGDFIVPNGTIITGNLENTIDTKVSQNNDRFKLTVQSPLDFRGAVIEGYISGVGRSGRVSGSSNITFNFETITLRDGRKYDFAGYLQGIKDQNGKTVKVDTEGTAKGTSQTRETVKRGGIGAGVGAIIGAIAGGGTGAAIGAVIGGGAGAGSVIVQGRDDVQLMPGSTITIQASSPVRDSQRVSEN